MIETVASREGLVKQWLCSALDARRGRKAASDDVNAFRCRRQAGAVLDLAGSAGQSGAGQARSADVLPECVQAVATRVVARRTSGRDHDSVVTILQLLRSCQLRIESPLVAPNWPQGGMVRSPEAKLRSSRGHSNADSVGVADWRPLATCS